MTQPNQYIRNHQNEILGVQLKLIARIEERNKKKSEIALMNERFKALEGRSTDKHAIWDVERYVYEANFQRDRDRELASYRNNTNYRKHTTQSEPKLNKDVVTLENYQVMMSSPHIWGRTPKSSIPRRNLADLTDDFIVDTLIQVVYAQQPSTRKEQPIQVPLHDYVVPPGTFEDSLNKNTPTKPNSGVIEWNTEIGPNNGNISGVHEFYMKQEQNPDKTGINETC